MYSYCYVHVFLLLCMFCFIVLSVYCVNVYCTTATGCQTQLQLTNISFTFKTATPTERIFVKFHIWGLDYRLLSIPSYISNKIDCRCVAKTGGHKLNFYEHLWSAHVGTLTSLLLPYHQLSK
jgi:hypothetical protein